MKSKWMVASMPVSTGAMFYSPYRLRDVDGVDHTGNREFRGVYQNKEDALRAAEKLNEEADDEQ